MNSEEYTLIGVILENIIEELDYVLDDVGEVEELFDYIESLGYDAEHVADAMAEVL